MAKKDFYEVLGISRDADDAAIKSAYRKLAKKHHPDLNPGDKAAEASFKDVNQAYEVLSDKSKRQQYDQFGHAAFDGSQGGGGYGGAGFGFDMDDIFGSIFGGGRRQNRNGPERGADLSYDAMIDFEEAAFGCKKEFTILRNENCPECSGAGAKDSADIKTCQRCAGTGSVRSVQNTIMGSFQSVTTCPECSGSGKTVINPCTTCKGKGRMNRQRKISVNIPAGIDNGQTISLSGEGDNGKKGGPSGDLYINIRVKPHRLFARNGADLNLEMKVSFATAALGGEIMIPTLEGDIAYQLPPGTQVGDILRINGKGIARLRSTQKGDLKVRVGIEVPRKLTERQKELLIEFDEGTNKRSDKKKGFFEKVKGKLDM